MLGGHRPLPRQRRPRGTDHRDDRAAGGWTAGVRACRTHGFGPTAFDKLKASAAGRDLSEARRQKQVKDTNAQMKLPAGGCDARQRGDEGSGGNARTAAVLRRGRRTGSGKAADMTRATPAQHCLPVAAVEPASHWQLLLSVRMPDRQRLILVKDRSALPC